MARLGGEIGLFPGGYVQSLLFGLMLGFLAQEQATRGLLDLRVRAGARALKRRGRRCARKHTGSATALLPQREGEVDPIGPGSAARLGGPQRLGPENAPPASAVPAYSHSMVAGGFEEMS